MLRTKSVRSPIDRSVDGLRILAARVRGHGMKKTRYDVWMPNLGPSEKLLRRARAGFATEGAWREFKRLYQEEMFAPAAVDKANVNIKNHGQKFTLRLLKRLAAQQNVTVMCHCAEEERHCHRHVLRELIQAS